MNESSIRNIGLEKSIEMVGATTIFGVLEPDELRSLLDGSSTRTYARQETVSWAGEAKGYAFLVLAGSVWLYRLSLEGQPAMVHEAASGDFFPGVSSRTYIDAIEDCSVVCRLGQRQYRETRRRRPEVGEAVEEMLAVHLAEAFDRIEESILADVGERLEHALARRARHGGAPLTREELAALVGASRQQVTASLCRLREAGVVEYEPHRHRGITVRRSTAESAESQENTRSVK